jgi:copper homeostasis protein
MPADKFLLEICVDSVESAIAAQRGGAQRIELCDNLMEGGTTPSAGALELARRELRIGIMAMIRPRGGDFCYSDLEFEVMQRDIEAARALGADGIVIGLLKPNGTVDKKRTAQLIELAQPLSVTFHRAFDMTRDPFAALETLIELGVDRVLTSGQESSVTEGLELIAELIRRAGDRIIIMPGGGIDERNLARIVRAVHPKEIHLTAFAPVGSPMQYRNPRTFMGGELRPPEYSRNVTDARRVRRILRTGKSS